jgi:plastocyanin
VGLIDGGSSRSSAPASAASGPAKKKARVPIRGFAFVPAKIRILVGGKVTFTNFDSAPHTATADQGAAFDTGTLMQNQKKTVKFATAGTFTYHCAFHPFMTGTVTVG